MFSLSNLSLQRGGNWLFKEVNLRVNAGDRIGLLGRNGCGKSSLIKLFTGELEVDEGELLFPGNTQIASTQQEISASTRSALDYVIDGHQQLRDYEALLAKAEAEDNTSKITTALQHLDEIQSYLAPVNAAKLLTGLGFTTQQHQTSVADFSGGWRMRLNLAQALMCPSNLLLLDEPTNHLDLDAVFWLEDWLKNYPGTLLLISHDAAFLDAVVTHIAHVDDYKITLYSGNYTDFTRQRAEKLALEQSMAKRQQRQKQHLQSFVDRFRAQATKAKQVQSRVKMLEKMGTVALARVASPVQFRFLENADAPNPLLNLKHADLGYDHAILRDVSFALTPGARIGLIGRNGSGKSTLIKTLGNKIQKLSGDLVTADKLKLGYFSQHQLETLRAEESPLWHLQKIAEGAREQELKNFLGSFGFSGERVLDPVKPFSGGEKARLCLALIIWQRPNLLLLDEPTNHLDLDTRSALNAALQEFTGAVVLVSHDRALLETSCDEYWLVDSAKVIPFKGDLEDYKNWLLEQKPRAESSSSTTKIKTASAQKNRKQQQALQRQQRSPLTQQIRSLEAALEELQAQQQQIAEQLSDNSMYQAEQQQQLNMLISDQAKTNKAIANNESEWLLTLEKLESLENKTENDQ
jgi:ATP-binding cassette subfamily F protein 3